MCLPTATHKFKWVKITDISLIWEQTSGNLDTYFIQYISDVID